MISVLTSSYNMGILMIPGYPRNNGLPDEQSRRAGQAFGRLGK